MNENIKIPWSVGDIGWAILKRSVKKSTECDKCKHVSHSSVYTDEVRECKISSVILTFRKDVSSINPSSDKIVHDYWYSVAFDIGDSSYPEHGRFTYGSQVSNVFASREEAESFLKEGEDT